MWLHTSHSSGAMLKSPTIKVGSANFSDQRVIRSIKSSFWPNLGLRRAVGNVAAGRDIDILQPDAAIEPGADMARLAIVLPVVTAADHAAAPATEDRDAMVHLLAIELVMDIAARMEQVGREDMILRLGFLQAEDVGLLLVEQPFDDAARGRGPN